MLIEYDVVPAVRWIATISPEQARVALETHPQFSGKIAGSRAVCDAEPPEWPRHVDVGRAIAAALAASTMRNRYAHATYDWSGDPASGSAIDHLVARVQTDGLTRNMREEAATIGQLDDEIGFMKGLIVAMRNSCEARAAGTPVDLAEIRALAPLAQSVLRDPTHMA